jgi:hypothetical protein
MSCRSGAKLGRMLVVFSKGYNQIPHGGVSYSASFIYRSSRTDPQAFIAITLVVHSTTLLHLHRDNHVMREFVSGVQNEVPFRGSAYCTCRYWTSFGVA